MHISCRQTEPNERSSDRTDRGDYQEIRAEESGRAVSGRDHDQEQKGLYRNDSD